MKKRSKVISLLLSCVIIIAIYGLLNSVKVKDWQVSKTNSERVTFEYLIPKIDLFKQIEGKPLNLYFYKKSLAKLAEKRGISDKEFTDVIKVADVESPQDKFPVLFEKAKYKGNDYYFITYQFDIEKGGVVGFLSKLLNPPSEGHHHYSLVVVDKATKKVIFSKY